MNSIRPVFIAVEGLDGTGKSTVIRLLAERCGCTLFKTPPDAFGAFRSEIDAAYQENDFAQQLFYASTVAHVSKLAETSLAAGCSVIVDRYWLTTKIYAGVRRQRINLDNLEVSLLRPDFTLYLHSSEAIRRERMKVRGMTDLDRRSCADAERLQALYAEELKRDFSGIVCPFDSGALAPEVIATRFIATIGDHHVP